MERKIRFNNDMLAWCVIGEKGAIHIWCMASDFTLGGIEMHSKEPQYENHDSRDDCWLIGKCYHDGSGLQYTERIRFYIGRTFMEESFGSNSQDVLWRLLAGEYNSRFNTNEQIDWDKPVTKYEES